MTLPFIPPSHLAVFGFSNGLDSPDSSERTIVVSSDELVLESVVIKPKVFKFDFPFAKAKDV